MQFEKDPQLPRFAEILESKEEKTRPKGDKVYTFQVYYALLDGNYWG